jgi:molybdopterin converting factor small subunit
MSVARLLLFGQAREAAGIAKDEVEGATVAEAVSAACSRYGVRFSEVSVICRVWVNGEPAPPEHVLHDGDEVAMLPPVSGG